MDNLEIKLASSPKVNIHMSAVVDPGSKFFFVGSEANINLVRVRLTHL